MWRRCNPCQKSFRHGMPMAVGAECAEALHRAALSTSWGSALLLRRWLLRVARQRHAGLEHVPVALQVAQDQQPRAWRDLHFAQRTAQHTIKSQIGADMIGLQRIWNTLKITCCTACAKNDRVKA